MPTFQQLDTHGVIIFARIILYFQGVRSKTIKFCAASFSEDEVLRRQIARSKQSFVGRLKGASSLKSSSLRFLNFQVLWQNLSDRNHTKTTRCHWYNSLSRIGGLRQNAVEYQIHLMHSVRQSFDIYRIEPCGFPWSFDDDASLLKRIGSYLLLLLLLLLLS